MDLSSFSEKTFTIPFEVVHYITNGEILNGLPSGTPIISPVGASLTNFRLQPQIDKFHYVEEVPEYVGHTLSPWPGTPINIAEDESISEDNCYYFGTLNRPALQLLANDECLRQATNEVFQKIDYVLANHAGFPTFAGMIGLGCITMEEGETQGSVEAKVSNNMLLSPKVNFGSYDSPAINGNNPINTDITSIRDHERQSRLIAEDGIPQGTYTMDIELSRSMFAGDQYLICVETSWAFAQYSKLRSEEVGSRETIRFDDIDFVHADIKVKHSDKSLVSMGTVGLVSSYEHFSHVRNGKSYESKRRYHAYVGAPAPGEMGSSSIGKYIFEPGQDINDFLSLDIEITYNAIGNHGARISKKLRDIYVSIRAL